MSRPDAAALAHAAWRVLIGNWRDVSTVPSPGLYPHQWSWDSAFIAIGLAGWAQRRARSELRSLLGGQWADGRVPHIVFDPAVGEDAYFPGPSFWRSGEHGRAPRVSTSGLVQPPLHAVAAAEVYRAASSAGRDEPGARAWLGRLSPRLAAQHAYLRRARAVGGGPLAAIVHPWESGLDNSPAWDRPLAAVPADLGLLRRYQRRDLQHAAAAHRPSDADYSRYVRLALAYRDGTSTSAVPSYDDQVALDRGEFVVLDPLFNAIYAWSEHALAEIASWLGLDAGPHHDRAAELTEALLGLWDERSGRFAGRDVRTGERLPERTIGGLVPLLLPGLPRGVVERLCATVTSPGFLLGRSGHAVPSYDATAPGFEPDRYWRGPTWINTDWLLWRGLQTHGRAQLAGSLADSMLGLVARSGFAEYYNPLTGAPCGSRDFSWTAALTLDVLARRETELVESGGHRQAA